MDLAFDDEVAAHYSSWSQKIRVMSERWVRANQFCPACGHLPIGSFANNRPVADFHCVSCGEEFELKSKRGRMGRTVADGAYRTMIERITSNSNPSFIFLSYDRASLTVTDLELVPKHFFSPMIIERRKPLALHARRAGWEGCKIRMDAVPASGRIALISNGIAKPKREVLQAWRSSIFLHGEPNITSRSWLLAVMMCIERMNKQTFTLADIYASEDYLSGIFPGNRHVRPKIRQQLQVLREQGYLNFVGGGVYTRAHGECFPQ